MTTPTLPATHRAGDTLADTFSMAEYPASAGWVLTFTLSRAAGKITITCSASGDLHVLSVAASTTAGWAAANYTWVAHMALSGVRATVANGSTQVLADLAGASGGVDSRTAARQALEAAEAALVTYGSRAYLQEITVGDRRQKFNTPGDFLAFVDSLRAQVKAEERAERLAQGLAPRNRLLVRFTGR